MAKKEMKRNIDDYAQGYEQGVFDTKLNYELEKTTVVEQWQWNAKEFIEQLIWLSELFNEVGNDNPKSS